jgi:nucleoside-diphosphate-sugar epimerase
MRQRPSVRSEPSAGSTSCRIVAQSIAFGCEDGRGPATEDTPLRAGLRGVPELESAVAELPEWVVLRYGLFYGPGTWYFPEGAMAERARAGELVADESVTSFVHVDDAAAAAVAAFDWPSGPVNICDDEPAAARTWVPVFCDAVHAPPPPRAATRSPGSRGANNHRARSRGWLPAVPSWWEGFRAFAGAATPTSP